MRLRCAAYARYSSDRQSPSSIDDQLRKCREYAERQGWEIVDRHIFIDEAMSGSGGDRPGFVRLREAASSLPKPFDIVLVDDTSRLSRNQGETARICEELTFAGVRIVAVSQGIDTQHEQADMLMTMHGMVDQVYIKELAKKTHRGLEGRALKGLNTGGRRYGYDNVPVPTVLGADGTPAVRQQINETEAAIIQRIFQMYAEGESLKRITFTFNAEHIPPPRKRTGRSFASWCPSAIREMLRREMYIGRMVWNRCHFVKRPGTNKRVKRENPESEWIIIQQPELRIIDDDLWDRVQQHIAWVNKKYNYGNTPGFAHRAETSLNLLTGFLQCGLCKANLIIVCGRGKIGQHRYGCPQNYNRGACSNALRQRADELERLLFQQLQEQVLRPEVTDYVILEFQRQLEASLAGLDSRIGRMRNRATQLQHEIRNLASTAALCGPTPALVQEINSRQQELEGITHQLLSAEPNSVSAEIGRIRQFVTAQFADIRQLLNADVRRAKAELEKHVTVIRMVPHGEGTNGYYVAEGEWDLLGGYGGGAGASATADIRMVAGEGFEPSPFGL